MSATAIASFDALQPKRGADILVEVLQSEGVRHVFGNPGTTEMPLMNALSAISDPSYILGLQEVSVVSMADGYAKASGRPGFANVHTAGGLGNAMGALIAARVGNTPLVITAGQQDTRHIALDPLLSGDLVSMARPAVKWAQEVARTDDIAMLVRRAFHDCLAAPAGPVFLSLPLDVMDGTTLNGSGKPSRVERASIAGALDVMSDALAEISPGHLALIAGDEVFTSDCSAEVVALAEMLAAPVFGSSWPGHLPFPTEHPLWQGNLPNRATDLSQLLGGFDAVLALGGQSIITYLYSPGIAVPPKCRLFHLSATAGELGRRYSTELACVGDLKASLRALLPMLSRRLRPAQSVFDKLRRQAVHDRGARHKVLLSRAATEEQSARVTPLAAAAELARIIPPHVAIVDEAPATMGALRSLLSSSATKQYYGMRSAILGWGMPASLGVSLGLGRDRVVCLVGDGSALYSPQALWTAAREKLPVTFVVINNGEYNILKNYVRSHSGEIRPGRNQFIGMEISDPAIDFLALAEAHGISARRVERLADIAGAVESGIASGRPNLIDLAIMPT